MKKEEKTENHLYSRREALRLMGLGAVGLTFGGSFIESCASNGSKSAAAPVFRYTPAPEGSKIVSRNWDSLGETVGLLGLGCMRLPSKPSQGGRGSGPLDQEQINAMVDYALAHGINYFDTAPAYGESEKAMGIALSRYPRESYLLATKMSNFAFGPNAPTLDAAKEMFERSLANLQTDHFDFFLLHSLSQESDFDRRFAQNGVLDYLFEQKNAGRIRHIGFSFHGSNKLMAKLLDKPYKWDFVQIQMNYVDWKSMSRGTTEDEKSDSETLYNMLVEKGIPVAVMEPIRGGALAGVSDGLKALMAEQHPELSPAGMALSFVGSFPGVMVTLSGMSNLEQLKENVATFTDFKPFTEKDNEFMMRVARLYNENTHIPCTGCAYCMPCPNGVNIPGNFAVFNDASDELSIPDPNGVHDAEYKKKSKNFVKRYEKELEAAMRADACTKCNACLSKCPQHIRIPEQLQMISDLVAAVSK